MTDFTAAAATAIRAHVEDARLEDDSDPSTDLFHLLASLLEWSDAQEPRVDFDATLEEARRHVGSGRNY